MSNDWCVGGLWPHRGQDAITVVDAIYDARYPAGTPQRLETIRRNRVTPRTPSSILPESWAQVTMASPLLEDWGTVEWTFDGQLPGGDRFFSNTSHRSARESRQATRTQAVHDGVKPLWDWQYDYFPFVASAMVNGWTKAEQWSIHEEYFWLARNVLIPNGWASYMYFSLGEPKDLWATVPGHTDPFKLPDDFLDTESEAWSFFDRPEPTEGAT